MSERRYIYVVGTGRCGLASLRAVLNAQPSTAIKEAEPPLLPWSPRSPRAMNARIQRKFANASEEIVGECGWFFLNYLEHFLATGLHVRVIVLERERESTIESLRRWVASNFAPGTNHWSGKVGSGLLHHPSVSQTFPKYDNAQLDDCLQRYWVDYHTKAIALQRQFPSSCRIFDTACALNSVAGQNELLDFCGYPAEDRTLTLNVRESRPVAIDAGRRRHGRAHRDDRASCAVLVPMGESIPIACERSLVALEKRGYAVKRLPGFAAIDQARNVLATQALSEGYTETMWIDSDIEFNPDDVDRLRQHDLPIVSGVYAKRGQPAIASNVMPETESFEFGKNGGLYEICYAGTGFLYVKREVYETMQMNLDIPVCNELFSELVIPFFHPIIREHDEAAWYLAEDFSFSHRARECGYKVMADTSIRLWHIGTYRFGWEDACRTIKRHAEFTMKFQ